MADKAKRKQKAIEHMLKPMEKHYPDNPSVPMVRAWLEKMPIATFEDLMRRSMNKEWGVPIFTQNMEEGSVRKSQAMAFAKDIGCELMQHIILVDPETGEEYLSPKKHLVVIEPVRRNVQHIVKKLSVSKDSNTVDHMTGQPTGASKSTKISGPESLVLKDKGIIKSTKELMKARGGDTVAFRQLNQNINTQGRFSLEALDDLDSRPQSTLTLQHIFRAMHLDNNLAE